MPTRDCDSDDGYGGLWTGCNRFGLVINTNNIYHSRSATRILCGLKTGNLWRHALRDLSQASVLSAPSGPCNHHPSLIRVHPFLNASKPNEWVWFPIPITHTFNVNRFNVYTLYTPKICTNKDAHDSHALHTLCTHVVDVFCVAYRFVGTWHAANNTTRI